MSSSTHQGGHDRRSAMLSQRPDSRRGAIAVLTAILLIPLMAVLAFCIDCGYLIKKRAELQRAADAAALAAVRDLVPDSTGYQDVQGVHDRVKEYAALNMSDVNGFTVLDEDITIGRFDPETIYSSVDILDDGVFDTVRVTLRRDDSANSPVPLLFGRIFGFIDSDVRASSTAVLQKATTIRPGIGVLPIVVPQQQWNGASWGDVWSIYGDGKITDASGQQFPGNFGTCDIGTADNSSRDITDQINTGLSQSDLDGLHNDGRIPTNTHIESSFAFDTNGDTGLSAGIKSAIQAAHGETRLVPIIDKITGTSGNNVEYHVVGWGVAELVDSSWQGGKKTKVEIRKTFAYDGNLRPNRDLGTTDGIIEGAFTAPVLVQ